MSAAPGRDAPTFAEMILTAHYQHIAPCPGEPCSCHYFEDLAVIRAALAAAAPPPAQLMEGTPIERGVSQTTRLSSAPSTPLAALRPGLDDFRAAITAAPLLLDVERLARALLPALRNFHAQYEGWSDDEALADVLAYVAPKVAVAYAAQDADAGEPA